MQRVGAAAYKTVSVDSGVQGSDPHRLIVMLYDGALAAIREAVGHLQAGRVAAKGAAIGKAIRIIEEGLIASLDPKAGGDLAQRLSDLYQYMTMRLLQANLRSDPQALDEVVRLLDDLRSAWASIGKPAPASGAQPAVAPAAAKAALAATGVAPAIASAAAPAATATPAAAAEARLLKGLAAAPARGFVASA